MTETNTSTSGPFREQRIAQRHQEIIQKLQWLVALVSFDQEDQLQYGVDDPNLGRMALLQDLTELLGHRVESREADETLYPLVANFYRLITKIINVLADPDTRLSEISPGTKTHTSESIAASALSFKIPELDIIRVETLSYLYFRDADNTEKKNLVKITLGSRVIIINEEEIVYSSLNLNPEATNNTVLEILRQMPLDRRVGRFFILANQ